MSTFTNTRDSLVTNLTNVTGIGKVLKSAPYSTDWQSFLSRFAVTHPTQTNNRYICVAWVSRRAFSEIETGKGSRDEAETIVAVTKDETWQMTVLVGYQDDDTKASEEIFNELVDRIADKFRLIDPATFTTPIEEAWPVQLESAGEYFFGEVLCHKAVLTIHLQHRLTT
jgi:hypothetical protein